MSENRQWASSGSVAGLFLALFSLPMISLAFTVLAEPLTTGQVVLREGLMFLSGIVLLLIARSEGMTAADLGMARRRAVDMAAVVLLGVVLMALIIALDYWISQRVGVLAAYGEPAGRPLWVVALIALRAGVLEELFYRAYAIGRLRSLTGSRWLAVLLPLLVFTLFHSTQGLSGMLLAFLGGAGLTALYLWSRNLWACMIVHFLVDYAPTALLTWYGF